MPTDSKDALFLTDAIFYVSHNEKTSNLFKAFLKYSLFFQNFIHTYIQNILVTFTPHILPELLFQISTPSHIKIQFKVISLQDFGS